MSETSLREFLQPYPGIGGFIFAPPEAGESRTWIFRASGDPKLILDFHLVSFMTHGWRVTRSDGALLAERGGAGVSVSALRRQDESRVIYEVRGGVSS